MISLASAAFGVVAALAWNTAIVAVFNEYFKKASRISALFAYAVPDDANHMLAHGWVRRNRIPLLLTDYIADETLTLMKARGESVRALHLGELIFTGRLGRLHFLTEDEVRAAWTVFASYRDKEWSFTDCTSKVVIEKLGLTHAFAFDRHFHQFGTVAVVP